MIGLMLSAAPHQAFPTTGKYSVSYGGTTGGSACENGKPYDAQDTQDTPQNLTITRATYCIQLVLGSVYESLEHE